MSDPVISPDGKFMWIDEKWVPLPQSTAEDSAIMQSNAISDSVVMGDVVNIVNKPEDIVEAISNQVCVFCETSGNLTFFACKSPVCDERYCNYCSEAGCFCPDCQILETKMIQIDSQISKLQGNNKKYEEDIKSMKIFEKKVAKEANIDFQIKEAESRRNTKIVLVGVCLMLIIILLIPLNLALKDSGFFNIWSLITVVLITVSLILSLQIFMLDGVRNSLQFKYWNLDIISHHDVQIIKRRILAYEKSFDEDLFKSIKQLYSEKLDIISKISDDQELEANVLISYGNMMHNVDESVRKECFTKAVRIQREIGISIQPWFIDNGY